MCSHPIIPSDLSAFIRVQTCHFAAVFIREGIKTALEESCELIAAVPGATGSCTVVTGSGSCDYISGLTIVAYRGAELEATVSGLAGGLQYSFAVTAVSLSGEGDRSEVFSQSGGPAAPFPPLVRRQTWVRDGAPAVSATRPVGSGRTGGSTIWYG